MKISALAGKSAFIAIFAASCPSEMGFSVDQPPQAQSHPVTVLYYLSGLTGRSENFMIKTGVQRLAAPYGLMGVAPDTSLRHTRILRENDDGELATGAGFYIDATLIREFLNIIDN